MSRLAILVLTLCLPASALAAPAAGRSYSARGTTLRARTLRIDLGPYERGINDSGTILGPFGSSYGLRIQVDTNDDDGDGDDVGVGFGAGISYGITDELEIGALLLPINTFGDDFGHITPYLRWAFVNLPKFQMGIQPSLAIPLSDNLGLGVGLPMNIRAGDRVRIETGVELEIYFDTGDDDGTDDEAYLNLDIPLALGIDVGRYGYIGPRVSFVIFDFDSLVVPIGLFGGAAFSGPRGNGAEFTGSFSYFIDNDGVVYPEFELVFGANLYFGL